MDTSIVDKLRDAELLAARKRIAELEAENERLGEALEAMLWQFAYRGVKGKRRMLNTGGLSALEDGFRVMGWKDCHYPRETSGCDWPDCSEWASSGTPTPDGYKRYCGEHTRDGFANARIALEAK